MLDWVAWIVVALLMVPIVLAGAGGLLFLVAALMPERARRIRETFHCPVLHRVVTAEFVVPAGAPHPSDVASCSAFRDPSQVACAKGCREEAEVRRGLSRGVFPRWALVSGGLVTWRRTEAEATTSPR